MRRTRGLSVNFFFFEKTKVRCSVCPRVCHEVGCEVQHLWQAAAGVTCRDKVDGSAGVPQRRRRFAALVGGRGCSEAEKDDAPAPPKPAPALTIADFIITRPPAPAHIRAAALAARGFVFRKRNRERARALLGTFQNGWSMAPPAHVLRYTQPKQPATRNPSNPKVGANHIRDIFGYFSTHNH